MDTTAAKLFLAAVFGPDRAAHIPDTCTVRLWVGDPESGGVEQSGPGYAAVDVDMDSWPALSSLTDASTSVLVDFPDATDEWPDDSTHYSIDFGGSVVFSAPLGVPVEVGSAGSFAPVQVSVFFQTEEF